MGEGVREGGREGGRRERFLFPMCPGSRRYNRGRAERQGALSRRHLYRMQYLEGAVHFYTF